MIALDVLATKPRALTLPHHAVAARSCKHCGRLHRSMVQLQAQGLGESCKPELRQQCPDSALTVPRQCPDQRPDSAPI